MRRRLLVILLGVVPLAVTTGLALASGNPQGRSSASALAVLVRLADGSTAAAGASVVAPPSSAANVPGWSYGQAVAVSLAQTSAGLGPGADPRGHASAELRGVSLFGGEITADHLTLQAEAAVHEGQATGYEGASSFEGLVVLGQAVQAGANQRIPLGDYGYAVALEQAVERDAGGRPGYRGFVTALHVYLTADHGGLPAGSEILVGYAEAAAEGVPAQADTTAASPAGDQGEASGGASAGSEQQEGNSSADGSSPAPPATGEGPPAIVSNPPADVTPQITGAGHSFPVYGPVSFTNDFAAPRADTIWHHGNDIFAATGQPVLAVASGTLFMVGWNTLGGHRLWLRDDQGNEYYYAHLSAYSPLAVDGTRVNAGDVIAFVGQSGASGGVPHLHFEIHPRALLGLGYDGVINPYTYLLAWQAQQDEEFSITLPPEAGGQAPEPGAVILGAQDISTASGLDPNWLPGLVDVEPGPGRPRR